MPALVVTGAGFGLMVAPIGMFTIADVPVAKAGAASGLFNTTTQLANAVGVAVLGTLFFGVAERRLPAAPVDVFGPAFEVVLVVVAALMAGGVRRGARAAPGRTRGAGRARLTRRPSTDRPPPRWRAVRPLGWPRGRDRAAAGARGRTGRRDHGLDRRRRLDRHLPHARRARAAAGDGQRLQHPRPGARRAERGVRLPRGAAGAPPAGLGDPDLLRRGRQHRRGRAAGAAARCLRGGRAVADPVHLPAGRGAAEDLRAGWPAAAATTAPGSRGTTSPPSRPSSPP